MTEQTSYENSPFSASTARSWQVRERTSNRIMERVQTTNRRLNTLCQDQIREIEKKQIRALCEIDKAKRHLYNELQEAGTDVTLLAPKMRIMSAGYRTRPDSVQTQRMICEADISRPSANYGNESGLLLDTSSISESDFNDVFGDDSDDDSVEYGGDVIIQDVLEAWNPCQKKRVAENRTQSARSIKSATSSSARSRLSVIYMDTLQEAIEEPPTSPAKNNWSKVREHVRSGSAVSKRSNGVLNTSSGRNHSPSSPRFVSDSAVCNSNRFSAKRPSLIRAQTWSGPVASCSHSNILRRPVTAYQLPSLMTDEEDRQKVLTKLRNDATSTMATSGRRSVLEPTTSRYLIRFDQTRENERVLGKIEDFFLNYQQESEEQ